jgi:bleomycin hydrolase
MVSTNRKAKEITAQKTAMLKDIYRILAMAYGEPVKEFKYAHVDKNGKAVSEENT